MVYIITLSLYEMVISLQPSRREGGTEGTLNGDTSEVTIQSFVSPIANLGPSASAISIVLTFVLSISAVNFTT